MGRIFKNFRALSVFALIGLLIFFLTGSNAFAQLTAKANHDHIKIDFFYSGSTVSVSGISDPGTDLIIKITSPDGHETLRKKGKVAGLLWMNVGELKIDHVPNVYFIHSTKKIEDILSNEEMQKYVIGYPALEKYVEISPVDNKQDESKWFAEFLKFKESKNLFGSSSGKITTIEKADGLQHYYILTQWPYQATPGDYTVTVYAVKNRKVIETASSNVSVEQVGTVKILANMAKTKGALYGLLSIVIAIAAGFGVGLVFRKSGGAH
jgi:uncharacterized protein (TIGR02186 family)